MRVPRCFLSNEMCLLFACTLHFACNYACCCGLPPYFLRVCPRFMRVPRCFLSVHYFLASNFACFCICLHSFCECVALACSQVLIFWRVSRLFLRVVCITPVPACGVYHSCVYHACSCVWRVSLLRATLPDFACSACFHEFSRVFLAQWFSKSVLPFACTVKSFVCTLLIMLFEVCTFFPMFAGLFTSQPGSAYQISDSF